MLKLYFVFTLAITSLFHHVTAIGVGCRPLPINHFQWLNPDGSLVIPHASNEVGALTAGDENELTCNDDWKPLPEFPGCQFCHSSAALVCEGSDVYNVPSSATLLSTRLSLFKMSGVGFISLPPKSFMGLTIQKLVIENSNLSYIASETFSGVKSIEAIDLKNNVIDYIPEAEVIFENIKNLKSLRLEDSRLRVLTSSGSANLHDLTYFSLAGNPLYTMDVTFLQNSGLTFLDLRNTTFNMKNMNIKGIGLSKLPNSLTSIDLSKSTITTEAIGKVMQQLKSKNITTLNLSFLQLQFQSFCALKPINTSLQFLSLEGTDLSPIFDDSESEESDIIKSLQFFNLKELSLENCNLSSLGSGGIFKAFPNLEILSIAGNNFDMSPWDPTFFLYLPKLLYIDLSDNMLMLFEFVSNNDIENTNLLGADLSNSSLMLSEVESAMLLAPLKNVSMISLCKTPMYRGFGLASALSMLKNLSYVDLSGIFPDSNQEPVIFNDFLSQNNSTLREFHFTQNNFKLSDYPFYFSQLTSLEILDISNNSVRDLSLGMFPPSLRTLNASQNLITTWYFSFLNSESQLNSLDVSNNQITYISNAMIEDFYRLNFLSIDQNPLICHNKVVALVCSYIRNSTQNFKNGAEDKRDGYQSTGLSNYTAIGTNNSHTLYIVDWQQYKCYDLLFNGFRKFSQEKDCNEYYEEVSTTPRVENPATEGYGQKTTTFTKRPAQKLMLNWEWAYFILGPIVLVSALGGIVYLKWWNIKCFIHRYISLRKARLLRRNGNMLIKPEVYYDVFVSYSDVDRAWVLDHLLPNMERDGDISLCFHERDFQVGMSILENIIDCMDRSHALLLVVSSAFIYSKWCQFEMHLAQYRLVETFRDQLVLVLLEDIPRKARPQTLHHLMMTKTYLMWPQEPCKDDAHELFWRRLKRALKPNPNYTFPV